MWLDELLNKINFAEFYPHGKPTGRNQIITNCPFHDDKVASLSINVETGLYYCHACSEKGNFLSWCKKQGIDLQRLAEQHGIVTKQKVIKEEIVNRAHQELLNSVSGMNLLREKRGITEETVRQFKLGIYNNRLSIPIYEHGELVNVRLYKSNAKRNEAKMLNFKEGYGTARLFPFDNIYEQTILLCEGELDCILACQNGYNAITGTTGAGTWRDDWNRFFVSKDVIICYDIDAPGRQGAKKISGKLKKYANSIKVINLPIDPMEIKHGDLTDYFVSLGNTKKDFDQLIVSTAEWQQEEEIKPEIKPERVTLSEASHNRYNNKKIEFDCLISGKDLAPYIVPKRVRMMCTMSASRAMCSTCQLVVEDGELEREIDHDNKDFLLFLDSDNPQKERLLKGMFDVNRRCTLLTINEVDSYNVERIILTPEIEYSVNVNTDTNYVTRTGYYVGHNIETNRVYNFTGRTISHPKTQQATHIIGKATPALSSIDSFQFTEEHLKQLKKFQNDNLDKKFKEIYYDIEQVTGIRQRLDMFLSILLTYCSPLQFYFDSKLITKGWLETLILGDTRTGKTEMAKSLIEYFKAGELVQGESASFAGLMGGLQQIGNRWHLNWGRIPLNNRRLVFIDEMSGLSPYEIGKFSGLRSSGIAEITKIRSEKTWARTRLIWLSNPRGLKGDIENKMLASYSQGVRAVSELIGKQEDISRFDLVTLISVDEVPINDINKHISKHEIKFFGDDFHNLIMWSWKMPPENIIIRAEEEQLIYKYASNMSDKYSQAIPLVIPSEQRIKIARVAIAVAAANFSTDDGTKLIIKQRHIDFAVRFLNELYDKPICAYNEFSSLEKSKHMLNDEGKIAGMLKRHPAVIDQLLDVERLTYADIQDMFDLNTRSEVRQYVNELLGNRAIKRTGQMYEKTPAFIRLIRRIKSNGVYEDQVEDEVEDQKDEDKDDWPF